MDTTITLSLLLICFFPKGYGIFGTEDEILEKACGNNPADIVFVLDESGSVWNPDFIRQLNFVNDIMNVFDVSEDMTYFGVMTFGDKPRVIFTPGEYKTHEELRAAVSSIEQARGGTFTADALRRMTTFMFANRRSHVPQIAIVITDGKSIDKDDTAQAAKEAKETNITILAIGVGRYFDREELVNMATSEEYVFNVTDYSALAEMKKQLATKACEVSTLPPPTTTTTTTTTTTEPTTTTTPAPTTTLPQMMAGCGGTTPIDVVLSLSDQSGVQDTTHSIDFFKSVLADMLMGPAQVQAGFAPRNCFTTEEIRLRDHDNRVTFIRDLERRKLKETGAWTDMQISYLREQAFSDENGGRENSNKFAVLIIDNKSADIKATMREARSARMNMELVVIGVGDNINTRELKRITRNDENIFLVPDYNSLALARDGVITRLCQGTSKSRREARYDLIRRELYLEEFIEK